jgi:hypothetical protein
MTRGFPLQDEGPGMNELFHDLSIEQEIADEFDLPSYNMAGRILFHFDPTCGEEPTGIEVLDYDSDKAPFWLHEAGFMDYTILDMVDLELEGYYVLEGVIGHAWQDYFGEYDEEWTFEFCRRASEEEIKTGALEG